MATPLKLFFDDKVVRSIARDLHAVHPKLDVAAFVRDGLRGLDDLELTARGVHIAQVMHRHLPASFEQVARILIASLGPEQERTEGFGMTPFRYLPHSHYVATHGLDHFEASMQALYELTKRFTAEFSIRPFLIKHPTATYDRLCLWASDPNVHVRRLVSEGTRPRLPWAPRLRAFQEDPRPVIALLERLKDDPERYVQRSVANNLNDIAKDHPDLATQVCQRWSVDATPARRWIVQHALRSLVKAGHRGALVLLGVGEKPAVRVQCLSLDPKRVHVGERLRFSFEICSTRSRAQELLVDYAVHFVKSDGATRPKVFKLRKVALPAGGRLELSATVKFTQMTTRRHHPGRHRIDVLVNGQPFELTEFELRADRS